MNGKYLALNAEMREAGRPERGPGKLLIERAKQNLTEARICKMWETHQQLVDGAPKDWHTNVKSRQAYLRKKGLSRRTYWLWTSDWMVSHVRMPGGYGGSHVAAYYEQYLVSRGMGNYALLVSGARL